MHLEHQEKGKYFKGRTNYNDFLTISQKIDEKLENNNLGVLRRG